MAEERERIARELHDVVSHHVSVIVIQAGAALRALDRRPADARTALEAIDASGRRAMADMRRMLGILGRGRQRHAGRATGDADDAAPMPGLDRLGELLEQVRATGQGRELAVIGDARPLPPGLELAAYRIVQEALTNTLKHAPEGHVTGDDPLRAGGARRSRSSMMGGRGGRRPAARWSTRARLVAGSSG